MHSIVRAFFNLQPGAIRVARGPCFGASINRSVEAYNANPEAERAKYMHDTDKDMTLWRLDGDDGYPIGMINWFPVHPTSMGSWFTLITGDNKGYASHVFEREHGTNHLLDRPRAFVAAFAQSNEGDVSPNIEGPRTSENEHLDMARMQSVAEAQLATARQLYEAAADEPAIAGPLRCVHQYIDYNAIPLTSKWHLYRDCDATTASGCIGLSMLSGTHFDGPGVSFISEGIQCKSELHQKYLTLVPTIQHMQKEKVVVFPTALYGISPSILPLQLVTIADTLALAAVPFEMTTMAGRRLRQSIATALDFDHGHHDSHALHSVIIAGLSNAYCGYMTTREEYAVQRYEGASTHFGPNQLVATQQQFDVLARAINSYRHDRQIILPPTEPAPMASIIQGLDSGSADNGGTSGRSGVAHWHIHTPVIQDSALPGYAFGDVLYDISAKSCFQRGRDKVIVRFVAGHPKNDCRNQSTFLEIHRWRPMRRDLLNPDHGQHSHDGGMWVMHADDGDEHTFYHWKRLSLASSEATIEWHIPITTPPGTYRIKHNGHYKLHWGSKQVVAYSGMSSAFEVVVLANENGHHHEQQYDSARHLRRFTR